MNWLLDTIFYSQSSNRNALACEKQSCTKSKCMPSADFFVHRCHRSADSSIEPIFSVAFCCELILIKSKIEFRSNFIIELKNVFALKVWNAPVDSIEQKPKTCWTSLVVLFFNSINSVLSHLNWGCQLAHLPIQHCHLHLPQNIIAQTCSRFRSIFDLSNLLMLFTMRKFMELLLNLIGSSICTIFEIAIWNVYMQTGKRWW